MTFFSADRFKRQQNIVIYRNYQALPHDATQFTLYLKIAKILSITIGTETITNCISIVERILPDSIIRMIKANVKTVNPKEGVGSGLEILCKKVIIQDLTPSIS